MFLHDWCASLRQSELVSLFEGFARSRKGFLTFFLVMGSYYAFRANRALASRLELVRELALDPLGAPRTPHAVVCCSGLLRSPADVATPWEVDLEVPWTEGQVHAVRFDTELLLRFGASLSSLVQTAKGAYRAVQLAASFSNPVSVAQCCLASAIGEINDIFDCLVLRAREAGRLLAGHLLELAEPGPGRRTVSLVGFSVGAVLLHACICELRRLRDEEGRVQAADLVCDVALLGLPVEVRDTSEWAAARQVVAGRFVVGFFTKDVLLLSYQARRQLRTLVGQAGLAQVPGVENVSLDSFLTVHADYLRQTPIVLSQVFG